MKCAEVGEEAREVETDDQMLMTCELEAAESLAGLARCSPQGKVLHGQQTESVLLPSSCHYQDQAVSAISHQQFCGYTSTPSPMTTKQTFETRPSRLCSTSYQSNSSSKLRQHLTEAEKEAQRLRRVLANRESARQTIRRRQDMYLELTRKATDLSEENENLKKEKELAVNVHTSLKVRNEILKTQMAKIKKAEPGGMPGEPKSSRSEISSSATTVKPIFLCHQPSLAPFFLDSIAPSSDVFQYQCASHFDVMSSLHFPMPQRDIPCSHQGQGNSNRIPRPGMPLFVLPVPCLLPFLAHSGISHSHSGSNDCQSETSSTHQCCMCSSSHTPEDNRQLSSPQHARLEATNSARTTSVGSVHGTGFSFPPDSCGLYTGHHQSKDTIIVSGMGGIRTVESLKHTRNSQNFDVNAVAAPEHITHWGSKNNQEPIICSHKKSEDAFATTEARRRRKELRKLKSVHNHHFNHF